jgi:regulator of cell morphogenesis and NO signaling
MIDSSMKVGELVAEHYQAAKVFKKYGIDFCCGGGKTVAEACAAKEVSLDEFQNQLATALTQNNNGTAINANRWNPAFLTDYIEQEHHTYVRETMPTILKYAQKVAKVHKDSIPASSEILTLFQALTHDLTLHLADEEQNVFPVIRKKYADVPVKAEELSQAIKTLEVDHETAGTIMKRLRQITNDFTPPEFACNTVRVLYKLLEEFEGDLHQHVHLENNVLFPKVADYC